MDFYWAISRTRVLFLRWPNRKPTNSSWLQNIKSIWILALFTAISSKYCSTVAFYYYDDAKGMISLKCFCHLLEIKHKYFFELSRILLAKHNSLRHCYLRFSITFGLRKFIVFDSLVYCFHGNIACVNKYIMLILNPAISCDWCNFFISLRLREKIV